MKREIKHPEKQVSTGSYSAAVECDGWLFVSGHAAQNLATGEVVHGTIVEETRLTLSHIGTVLAQAGCTFRDVVKCTCHLADINDFEEFDKDVPRILHRGEAGANHRAIGARRAN